MFSCVFYHSYKSGFITGPLAVMLPLRENQINVHIVLYYFHCDLAPIKQDLVSFLPCIK